MKLKYVVLVILSLGIIGCDYKFREAPTANENANNSAPKTADSEKGSSLEVNKPVENSQTESNSKSNAGEQTDEKLVLIAIGENKTIPCGGRDVELTEEATANSYTFTGECKKLTVNGVSNKVSVEKVAEIVVSGVSNKVAYGEGPNGKKPTIKSSGKSNVVETIKSSNDRKAAENN